MAAGPVTIRTIEEGAIALQQWQCLKAPIGTAETALTAAKLLDDMRAMSAAESTVEVIPVGLFDMIQVMVMAVGADGQSPVLDLYGWPESGPGHHIGTLTLDLSTAAVTASTGFHTNARTHKSIRDNFAAASTWLIPDQYVVTADYEQERFVDSASVHTQYFRALSVPGTSAIGGTIGTSVTEANFPQVFNVDFSQSKYSFFGVLPTALDSATSVGAIFRAIRMRWS